MGWSFDFDCFTVQLDPDKLSRLLSILRQLQSSPKCTVIVLEMLWLCNLFSALRPSLAPLYIDQHTPVPNMCAIAPEILCAHPSLLTSESPALFRLRPYPWAASSCVMHTHTHTADLPEVVSSRHVWDQVSNPLRPGRELSAESREVVSTWTDIAASPCPFGPFFSVHYLSARPSQTHAQTLLLPALEDTLDCLTDVRLALHAPSQVLSLQTCSRGSRPIPLRSTALPSGRC